MSPFACVGISSTVQPHIVAVAGLVPCAASGHDDLDAREVVARLVVRADHRHAGEFALRARHRRERHAAHAGDFLQHLLQFEQDLQDALPVDSGASGCRLSSSGSIAYWLHAFGLYFIVHDPSG